MASTDEPGANTAPASNQDLAAMVAESDTGARSPGGSIGLLLAAVAFAWSIFQLYFSSPVPFMFTQWFPGNWIYVPICANSLIWGAAMALVLWWWPKRR